MTLQFASELLAPSTKGVGSGFESGCSPLANSQIQNLYLKPWAKRRGSRLGASWAIWKTVD